MNKCHVKSDSAINEESDQCRSQRIRKNVYHAIQQLRQSRIAQVNWDQIQLFLPETIATTESFGCSDSTSTSANCLVGATSAMISPNVENPFPFDVSKTVALNAIESRNVVFSESNAAVLSDTSVSDDLILRDTIRDVQTSAPFIPLDFSNLEDAREVDGLLVSFELFSGISHYLESNWGDDGGV